MSCLLGDKLLFYLINDPYSEINVARTFTVEGSSCVLFASTVTMRCFKCRVQGHQRRNFPIREAEAGQAEQEEAVGVQGAQEEEPLQDAGKKQA